MTEGCGLLAVGTALLVVCFVLIMKFSGDFREECEAMGGSVINDTKTVTSINPANGQPVVGMTNTSFCLSDDGRILKVN